MKNLKKTIATFLLSAIVFSMTSCNLFNDHVHHFEPTQKSLPSCISEGYEEYFTCLKCGKMYSDNLGKNEISEPVVIEALGHSFTKYESNNDATYLKDGTKTAQCDYCGATDTVVDEGTKKQNPLTEEEYLNQVACYGTTNTPQGDRALKRGRITVTIPMAAGTKVTFVGDSSVYKYSVIRTNNPSNPTAGGDTYQIDPGWNETWSDPTCFILPQPPQGMAPEYIVIVFTRVDGANLSEEEIQNLHNLVKIEGNKAIETNYEGVLTEEEYERQAAHYGSVTATYKNSNKRMRISFAIRMEAGAVVKFLGDSTTYKWAVVETADTSVITKILDSGWNESWADPSADYVSKINGSFLVLTVAKLDNSALGVDDLAIIHDMFKVEGNKFTENGTPIEKGEQTLHSIAHRGYSAVAPENTLIAYRYAYLAGFGYVECDVTFTKDGYAVLLHDSTIDRTSNGSGAISEMTLAEARSYDYGSWKDMSFAGEVIPTFEEFIALCAELGLHPYIEIKGSITDAQAQYLVEIVNKYNYLDNCSWISFDAPALNSVLKYDDTARIGYVCYSVNNSVIDACLAIKTDKNQVFVDLRYTDVNANAVDLCKNAQLPIEVWTVNTEESALALDSYITGIASDWLYAGNLIKAD